MGPVHMYIPKTFCQSKKTRQKKFVTDTPSPNVCTLESEINVPVRLLILKDFPTRTALISDRTFIDSESSLL